MSDDYEGDWETVDEDETPRACSFKVMDLAGAIAHTAGHALIAIGGGLQSVATLLSEGAHYQRLVEQETAELARDRAEFDSIIALPINFDQKD